MNLLANAAPLQPMLENHFFVTGGTLRADAPCYVERRADRDLLSGLQAGDFCYVLTSRQMGKSSLMIRTAHKLRAAGGLVGVVDLTALGQNLSPEQWYDGLLSRLGRQLNLEEHLEKVWRSETRLSPVQRFITALHDVVLHSLSQPVAIFVDEIDVVRSLPFQADEFFAAIRECYNRRAQEPEFSRLAFCLLGIATPAELIRNPATTPFNVGTRIELADFSEVEASPFADRLGLAPAPAREVLARVFHWTQGHPYLTQKFCRAIAEGDREHSGARTNLNAWIDHLCDQLFLSAAAREQDDNLLFVRERILRSEMELSRLLDLYGQIHREKRVRFDETDEPVAQLRLAGIVALRGDCLEVRNPIYRTVFDTKWIEASRPMAELESFDGQRVRLFGTFSLGRAPSNHLVLPDAKVSRRHAMIQAQKQGEFWIIDLGSSNGTYVNGRRIAQPVLLRHQNQIELGPFRLVFHQPNALAPASTETSSSDHTIATRTIFRSKP